MIPILYQTMTEGTVPTNYGIGPLTDCISCKVTEERNGTYELTLTYAAEGLHASEIQPNRFIMVKPNYTDNAQIFRIYKVGKAINGKFTVNASHISYDLSGKLITTGTAGSAVAACLLLDAQAGAFEITTDINTSASFEITAPGSVRSFFGGKEGSLLDVYGGEWYYDNYNATLKSARGLDRGVTIRYGKNLTDLSQVLDMSNLCTGVLPYYLDANGNKTVGTKVATGLTLDVTRDVAIDFSADVNPDSGIPIATQLSNLANSYIANNNLTTFSNNITLDFVQMQGLTERVDLCDTVHIYFEPLGITATAKCIKTVWDVIEERYTKCTFGDARTDITDTIASNTKKVQQSASRDYVNESSQLITGNLGGYVILDDSDGDGKPDQILIMNTDDKTTATQVWRFNKNGLGYGTSYSGPFNDIALTSDGKINASTITTGTLNADLIKAGVISDTNDRSSIDMTSGVAKLYQLVATHSFKIKTYPTEKEMGAFFPYSAGGAIQLNNSSEQGRANLFVNATSSNLYLYAPNGNHGVNLITNSTDSDLFLYAPNGTKNVSMTSYSSGSNLLLSDTNGTNLIVLGAYNNSTGYINLRNSSGTTLVAAGTTGSGGGIGMSNNSNVVVAELKTGGAGDGIFYLKTSTGTDTIYGLGQSGQLVCVTLYQTSSRKVKENIEPIPDADKILELDAVKFDYKNKDLGTDRRGFIAEDVAKVLPNLVTPETDDRPASLDYVQMIPYLQAVIKEQDERIKALEDRLNKLEG